MKMIVIAAQMAVVLLLVGCVPVLVGGAFYSHNVSKKSCSELNKSPDLVEKLKIPEFKAHYNKVCKSDKKKEEP